MSELTATAKPTATVFYSWQSDLPNSTNRGFIEDCLHKAIKALGKDDELLVIPNLDRDTAGTAGAKDIADTIFAKINECRVFVADVSIVNMKVDSDPSRVFPNPNVLLELGYAAKTITWDNVLCVLNLAFGKVEDLPFDLRKRTIITYTAIEGEEKTEVRKALASTFERNLRTLLSIVPPASAPAIEIGFSDPATEAELGDCLEISTKLYSGIEVSRLPNYTDPATPYHAVTSVLDRANVNYNRELAQYIIDCLGTATAVIQLRNSGTPALKDVRLTLEITNTSGLFIKELVDVPSGKFAMPVIGRRGFDGDVQIRQKHQATQLDVHFAMIRGDETVHTLPFQIGADKSGTYSITGKVYSSDLPAHVFTLSLSANVDSTSTNNGLFKALRPRLLALCKDRRPSDFDDS